MVEQIAADLACFLRAAQLAPTMQSDLTLAKISRVEAAWQVDTMDDATFGWVVALRDGRRFYLEYTMEDAEAAGPRSSRRAPCPTARSIPRSIARPVCTGTHPTTSTNTSG